MSSEAETITRPCAYCGKPVEQRAAAGRPYRYCRDNDGACQSAARNTRLRHRNSPGLAGQVAKAYEVVERLEQVAETLTEALEAELSPVGVERQLAEVRAEAAGQIALAHTERDEARHDAERAARAAHEAQVAVEQARAAAQERVQVLQEAADAAVAAAQAQAAQERERAEQAERAAEAASAAQTEAVTRLTAERDAASREQAAAEALRIEAYKDRDATRTAADQMQTAFDLARGAAEEAGRESDALRVELARAEQLVESVHSDFDRVRAEHAQAIAALRSELDGLRHELETARAATTAAESARAAAEQLAQQRLAELAVAGSQRDAASAETVALRSRVDDLTTQVGQLASTLTQVTSRFTMPAQATGQTTDGDAQQAAEATWHG